VRIELERYKELKAHLENQAVHRSFENICGEFARLGFEPYAPVKLQHEVILNRVNWLPGFER